MGPCWNYCEVVNQAIMRCPGDCILLYSIQEELYECFSLHVRSYAIILHRGSDVAEIPEMRNSLPCIFFEYLHASSPLALRELVYCLRTPWLSLGGGQSVWGGGWGVGRCCGLAEDCNQYGPNGTRRYKHPDT